ncbi:MAG: protein kinase domain-containing protein [Actinomycetota bacterium]
MQEDDLVGRQIGGYRILGVLGRGGMGVVYLADQVALDRHVALKVVAPELTGDQSFRDRLVREARVAARIDHPNVIPVYDAGDAGGVLYIAMRYAPGTDLKRSLEVEGQLDPARTVRVLADVAGALDAAHARGLVHRDVKPANILLEPVDGSEERVYLTDFGLTRHLDARSRVTRTGFVVGTVDYMAPEQLRGEDIDGGADQYSLGCMLYECLTGGPPFDRDADAQVIAAHLVEPLPSVAARRAGIPGRVDEVLARATAKSRRDRYPSCGEFLDDIAAALGERPRTQRPARAVHTATITAPPPPGAPVPAAPGAGEAPRPSRVVSGPRAPDVVQPEEPGREPIFRECPTCRAPMPPDQRACPRCGRESEPWWWSRGVWWAADERGKLRFLDEDQLDWLDPDLLTPESVRGYRVRLLSSGDRPKDVVNALWFHTNWELGPAARAVKDAPFVVAESVPLDRATEIGRILETAGAKVEIARMRAPTSP